MTKTEFELLPKPEQIDWLFEIKLGNYYLSTEFELVVKLERLIDKYKKAEDDNSVYDSIIKMVF